MLLLNHLNTDVFKVIAVWERHFYRNFAWFHDFGRQQWL